MTKMQTAFLLRRNSDPSKKQQYPTTGVVGYFFAKASTVILILPIGSVIKRLGNRIAAKGIHVISSIRISRICSGDEAYLGKKKGTAHQNYSNPIKFKAFPFLSRKKQIPDLR